MVWETQGGGPSDHVYMGVRRRAQGLRLQEVVGQSQGNWYPSMLVARKWGTFCAYSAPVIAGLWEPAGGWRLRGRRELSKGHIMCSQRPEHVEAFAGSALDPPPGLTAALDMGFTVSGWAAQAGLGGWPLLPDRPAWP